MDLHDNSSTITIVSGLPRSGTSMMMKMLEAGGLPVVVDNIRKADEDNPNGYYEFEQVKKIKQDTAWLDETRGKVFKMVSMLLLDLPENRSYTVVFMRRTMDEILASQKKMLLRNGQSVADQEMVDMGLLYKKHLNKVERWLAERAGRINCMYVDYNRLLSDPARIVPPVNEFLGKNLDLDAMLAVVDRSLYRNKAAACG